MPLVKKLTVGEYEELLKKATDIQVLEDMLDKDTTYRASAIKVGYSRAKWVGFSIMKWAHIILRNEFEKYENKPIEQPKSTSEEPKVDTSVKLYQENQAPIRNIGWLEKQ